MLQRRDRHGEVAEAWLRATGLSAILIASTDRDTPPSYVLVGDAALLSTATASVPDSFTLYSERWFLNLASAHAVFNNSFFCKTLAGGAFVPLAAEEATGRVESVACAAKVQTRGPNEVVAQAMAVAAKIIQTSENQRLSGELRDLNRNYRQYRARQQANNTRAMDYHDWLQLYRLRMAEAAGLNVKQALKF